MHLQLRLLPAPRVQVRRLQVRDHGRRLRVGRGVLQGPLLYRRPLRASEVHRDRQRMQRSPHLRSVLRRRVYRRQVLPVHGSPVRRGLPLLQRHLLQCWSLPGVPRRRAGVQDWERMLWRGLRERLLPRQGRRLLRYRELLPDRRSMPERHLLSQSSDGVYLRRRLLPAQPV